MSAHLTIAQFAALRQVEEAGGEIRVGLCTARENTIRTLVDADLLKRSLRGVLVLTEQGYETYFAEMGDV